MERLKERFDEVVAKMRALPASGPAQPSNDLKLKLYGLFRQARDAPTTACGRPISVASDA
jgi:acyl-CoA-binding protein